MAVKALIDRFCPKAVNVIARERDLERRTVLCATDGLSQSDAAVQRAQAIARALGAHLLLLHVVDAAQPVLTARRRSARAQFLLDAHARWGNSAQVLVRPGGPHQTIAAVAMEWDVDLIVLGAHRPRVGDGLLGTTAERIARRAQRPVLVVNSDAAAPYQHVLLTADLSRMSAGVARVTKQLGLLKRSGVSVVHALGHRGRAMLYLVGAKQSEVQEYQSSMRRAVSDEIDVQLFSAGLDSGHIRIFAPQVAPVRAIEQVAKQVGSDLVVVGSSRFPVLKRWFIGSVSNEVLRRAEHDVLLVSPKAARRARRQAAALARQRLETESCQQSLELH